MPGLCRSMQAGRSLSTPLPPRQCSTTCQQVGKVDGACRSRFSVARPGLGVPAERLLRGSRGIAGSEMTPSCKHRRAREAAA